MHSIKNLHLMCTPMLIMLTIAKRGEHALLLINIVNHVSSQPQNCKYNPNPKQTNKQQQQQQ